MPVDIKVLVYEALRTSVYDALRYECLVQALASIEKLQQKKVQNVT